MSFPSALCSRRQSATPNVSLMPVDGMTVLSLRMPCRVRLNMTNAPWSHVFSW